MNLKLHFEGEVVEDQRLLNGARYLSIEGRTEESAPELDRTLTLNLEQPKDAGASIQEGDLTLLAPDGSLFAGLKSGRADMVIDEFAGDERERLDLTFQVSAGEGALQGFEGQIALQAELSGERATMTLSLRAES